MYIYSRYRAYVISANLNIMDLQIYLPNEFLVISNS